MKPFSKRTLSQFELFIIGGAALNGFIQGLILGAHIPTYFKVNFFGLAFVSAIICAIIIGLIFAIICEAIVIPLFVIFGKVATRADLAK